MEVNVTARHFRPSPRLRAFTEEKFGRLSRFAPPGGSELHVVITAEKKRYRVEASLGSLVLRQEADDVIEALEKAADRMKERLRKDHEKRREHKGRMGLRHAGNGRPTTRRVAASPRIRRENHTADEIGVEEAAQKLAKSRKDVLVFISSETGEVNVMYRRKDGQLGLIEPEQVESQG